MKKIIFLISLLLISLLSAQAFGQATLGGTAKMGGVATIGTSGVSGVIAVVGTPPAEAGNLGGATATTASYNTTGATLIVVAAKWTLPNTTHAVTDSKSNGAFQTCLTPLSDPTAGVQVMLCYYAGAITVGSGHTFSLSTSSGSGRTALNVVAFSGTATTAVAAFDTSNTGTGAGATCATGSITPAQTGEALVYGSTANGVSATGFAINSSFTSLGFIASGAVDGATAYLIDSVATAISPSGTWTGDTNTACQIAAFKHP